MEGGFKQQSPFYLDVNSKEEEGTVKQTCEIKGTCSVSMKVKGIRNSHCGLPYS